jgi:hypothetical protein
MGEAAEAAAESLTAEADNEAANRSDEFDVMNRQVGCADRATP